MWILRNFEASFYTKWQILHGELKLCFNNVMHPYWPSSWLFWWRYSMCFPALSVRIISFREYSKGRKGLSKIETSFVYGLPQPPTASCTVVLNDTAQVCNRVTRFTLSGLPLESGWITDNTLTLALQKFQKSFHKPQSAGPGLQVSLDCRQPPGDMCGLSGW